MWVKFSCFRGQEISSTNTLCSAAHSVGSMWRSNTLTCKPTWLVSGCMSEFHFPLKATLMSRFHSGSWSRSFTHVQTWFYFFFCIKYLHINVPEQRWSLNEVGNNNRLCKRSKGDTPHCLCAQTRNLKSHLVSAPWWSCDFNPCCWSLNRARRRLQLVEPLICRRSQQKDASQMSHLHICLFVHITFKLANLSRKNTCFL